MSRTSTETSIEARSETMGALEAKIEWHPSRFKVLVGEDGKRLVVKNGTRPVLVSVPYLEGISTDEGKP
ncbi:MAG: hypothetical protein WCL50_09855 [Spirochaetota bacterium]